MKLAAHSIQQADQRNLYFLSCPFFFSVLTWSRTDPRECNPSPSSRAMHLPVRGLFRSPYVAAYWRYYIEQFCNRLRDGQFLVYNSMVGMACIGSTEQLRQLSGRAGDGFIGRCKRSEECGVCGSSILEAVEFGKVRRQNVSWD